jgi:hypothetical protein
MSNTPSYQNKPKIPFASMREYKSRSSGDHYYMGYLGKIKLLMFRDRDFVPDPEKSSALDSWVLYVTEADPKPSNDDGRSR